MTMTEPTLERDGWELLSAEEQHLAAPASFHIPSIEERSTLGIGQQAKLLFLLAVPGKDLVQCERMWVRVTEVTAQRYSGVLESMPVTTGAIDLGAHVSFGPEHVAAVMIPKTDPRHPHYGR